MRPCVPYETLRRNDGSDATAIDAAAITCSAQILSGIRSPPAVPADATAGCKWLWWETDFGVYFALRAVAADLSIRYPATPSNTGVTLSVSSRLRMTDLRQ